MYCPLCAGLLKQIPRPPGPEIDWDAEGDELDKQIKNAQDWEDIQREEYECVGNRCFRADYPLYFHHPLRGIDSRPGDSWSLSWVK